MSIYLLFVCFSFVSLLSIVTNCGNVSLVHGQTCFMRKCVLYELMCQLFIISVVRYTTDLGNESKYAFGGFDARRMSV